MNYNVPPDYQIYLNRKLTTKTLNNYSKKEVIDTLLECLAKGLIIDANYWAAELFASGLHLVLWDCVLQFYFGQIHICSPWMIDYLNQKHLLFGQIKKLYSGQLNSLCNNQELRNHLAEMITVMCLIPHEGRSPIITSLTNTPPDNLNSSLYDDDLQMKTHKLIQLLVPDVVQQSVVYRYFFIFIMNYYVAPHQCLYYINWFINDREHSIGNLDLTVPPTLSHKSMWLIWKFLLKQDRHDVPNETFETLFNFYLLVYRRKDYTTCLCILQLVLTLCRCPEQVQWASVINVTNAAVIRQCAEVNQIYRNLQASHADRAQSVEQSKNRPKRKSKKQMAHEQFYGDSKNTDFLQTINNANVLMRKPKNRPIYGAAEAGAVEPMPDVVIQFEPTSRTRSKANVKSHKI